MSPSDPDLAALDTLRPLLLDPSIWERNLAAVRSVDSDLAALLRAVVLPTHWRPALGLDDAPTWRVEPPAAPAAWLAGSAAPRTRAAALLGEYAPAGRNPALPTIGAGAEIGLLLPRLPSTLALFVFEAELAACAAVLRTVDVSRALAESRCVLLAGDEAETRLATILAAQPGLLPPGQLVCPQLVAPARVDALRALCERRHAACEAARQAAIAALPPLPGVTQPSEKPRMLIAAPRAAPDDHELARRLARAAQELGWPVASHLGDSPLRAHPLALSACAAEFRPEVVLGVNVPPRGLPIALPVPCCAWFTSSSAIQSGAPLNDTTCLGAAPGVGAALDAAGGGARRVEAWPPACDSADFAADEPDASRRAVVIGDLPEVRAAPLGIDQPTHRELWAALRTIAARRSDSFDRLHPAALLDEAERATTYELRDAELRARWLALLQTSLIPHTVLTTIVQTIAAESFAVDTVGLGWEHFALPGVRSQTVSRHLPPSPSGGRPLLCLVAASPEAPPAVLQAAARGWPLLMDAVSAAALRAVLAPEQHMTTVASVPDVRAAIRALRSGDSAFAARAARAADHLRSRHTYARRLAELLCFLRPGA